MVAGAWPSRLQSPGAMLEFLGAPVGRIQWAVPVCYTYSTYNELMGSVMGVIAAIMQRPGGTQQQQVGCAVQRLCRA